MVSRDAASHVIVKGLGTSPSGKASSKSWRRRRSLSFKSSRSVGVGSNSTAYSKPPVPSASASGRTPRCVRSVRCQRTCEELWATYTRCALVSLLERRTKKKKKARKYAEHDKIKRIVFKKVIVRRVLAVKRSIVTSRTGPFTMTPKLKERSLRMIWKSITVVWCGGRPQRNDRLFIPECGVCLRGTYTSRPDFHLHF